MKSCVGGFSVRTKYPPRQNHVRWGAVAAVFSNPLSVVDFRPVEDGDVVVAAVIISFHIKLLELHFNNLQQETGFFHQAQACNSPQIEEPT